MGETFGVGAAVRFHHDAIQPDHDRPIIPPRIQPLAQPVQARAGNEIGDLGRDAASEHVAQQVADQFQRAFAGFQRDVAGEPVGDHDVGGPERDVVALDEAVETRTEMTGAQDFGHLAQRLVALHFLHADIQ